MANAPTMTQSPATAYSTPQLALPITRRAGAITGQGRVKIHLEPQDQFFSQHRHRSTFALS
jgi:hypothetical protein